MNFPLKAHYATVAMLALARQFEQGGIATVRSIAEEHEIPPQFLVQIMQQLRAGGLVTSSRGSSGGFRLERSPSTISLFEIVESVCPPSTTPNLSNASSLGCIVQEVWAELEADQNAQLRQVKLSELLTRADSNRESMFYI